MSGINDHGLGLRARGVSINVESRLVRGRPIKYSFLKFILDPQCGLGGPKKTKFFLPEKCQ